MAKRDPVQGQGLPKEGDGVGSTVGDPRTLGVLIVRLTIPPPPMMMMPLITRENLALQKERGGALLIQDPRKEASLVLKRDRVAVLYLWGKETTLAVLLVMNQTIQEEKSRVIGSSQNHIPRKKSLSWTKET
jgi:hypothetical protein